METHRPTWHQTTCKPTWTPALSAGLITPISHRHSLDTQRLSIGHQMAAQNFDPSPQIAFIEAALTEDCSFISFMSSIEIWCNSQQTNSAIVAYEAIRHLISTDSELPRYYFCKERLLQLLLSRVIFGAEGPGHMEEVAAVVNYCASKNWGSFYSVEIQNLMAICLNKMRRFSGLKIVAKLVTSLIAIHPKGARAIFSYDSTFEGFQAGILARISSYGFRSCVRFVLFDSPAKSRSNCRRVLRALLMPLATNYLGLEFVNGVEELSFRSVQEFPGIFEEMLDSACETGEQFQMSAGIMQLLNFIDIAKKKSLACPFQVTMASSFLNFIKVFDPIRSRALEIVSRPRLFAMDAAISEAAIKRDRTSLTEDGLDQLIERLDLMELNDEEDANEQEIVMAKLNSLNICGYKRKKK